MQLKTYTPIKEDNADFYIQSKGYNAGKPLRKPIPNCWAVYSDFENAFEFCLMLYYSKQLKNLIRGSVIPFISLAEYKKLIEREFDLILIKQSNFINRFDLINKIDALIEIKQKEFQQLSELKRLQSLKLYQDLQHKKP